MLNAYKIKRILKDANTYFFCFRLVSKMIGNNINVKYLSNMCQTDLTWSWPKDSFG